MLSPIYKQKANFEIKKSHCPLDFYLPLSLLPSSFAFHPLFLHFRGKSVMKTQRIVTFFEGRMGNGPRKGWTPEEGARRKKGDHSGRGLGFV